jgi:glycosyltransferase involved in cell wall biosynthesis
MISKPILVSILIPCYNAEKTIIQTVMSALNQDYDNIEILVNDDYSTDNTYQILKNEFSEIENIKIFRNQRNLGIAGNWNMAFGKANGEYWVKLDGDDMIAPSFISTALKIALKHDCDFTGTSFVNLDLNTKKVTKVLTHQFFKDGLLESPLKSIFIVHPFHLCFILLKADFVRKMNPPLYFIDTEVCDAEFQIRAALNPHFKAYFIKQELGYYCHHGRNSSLSPLKQARSFIYDVIPIHHFILKEKLGLPFRKKLIKNFYIYLKLMVKRKAPVDFNLLFNCLKYALT